MILFLLASAATGLHDSCIRMDETINSVCACVDSVENCAAVNETICMDGTDDHFIYLMPCSNLPSSGNYSGAIKYGIVKTGEGVQNGWLFLLSIILVAGVVLVAKRVALS